MWCFNAWMSKFRVYCSIWSLLVDVDAPFYLHGPLPVIFLILITSWEWRYRVFMSSLSWRIYFRRSPIYRFQLVKELLHKLVIVLSSPYKFEKKHFKDCPLFCWFIHFLLIGPGPTDIWGSCSLVAWKLVERTMGPHTIMMFIKLIYGARFESCGGGWKGG